VEKGVIMGLTHPDTLNKSFAAANSQKLLESLVTPLLSIVLVAEISSWRRSPRASSRRCC